MKLILFHCIIWIKAQTPTKINNSMCFIEALPKSLFRIKLIKIDFDA